MLEKKLALIAVNPVNLISLLEKELGGIANIDFPTLGGLVFGIHSPK